MHRDGMLPEDMTNDEAHRRVVKAIGKGLLKVLSKMGISTIRSYTGAQIFEAVGIDKEVVDRHFTGTTSRIGGVGLDHLAREALDRHARAYPAAESQLLPSGGIYSWRRDGEFHGWNPETVATLQHAARAENGERAGGLRPVRPLRQRGGRAQVSAARAAALRRRPRADRHRRGGAGQGDRQALQVRRHVAGRAVAGGARDRSPWA